MRKSIFLLSAVVVALFGGLLYTLISPASSAQKISRAQWEYVAITAVYALGPATEKIERIYGMTEICYAQSNGCKRQEVRQELDYGAFLQERGLPENPQSRRRASIAASEMAFQKTLAQLGSDGWEIVGAPDLKFEFVPVDDYYKYENKSLLFTREDTRAVYFKRLKAQ